MKNLFLLPTYKPSKLAIKTNFLSNKVKLHLRKGELFTNGVRGAQNQNIYITSDETIKEGDWCIEYDDIDKKWLTPYKPTNESWDMVSKANYCRIRGTVKKIILTTDQDLIADGVQSIDDEFLEWFVKNPSCEYIQTTELSLFNGDTGESGHYKYEIIIPQEEPKQDTVGKEFYESADKTITVYRQETLEEVAERWNEKQTLLDFGKSYNAPNRIKAFIEGAKWQQEQDKNKYSEEEVLRIITSCKEYLSFGDEFNEKQWFEQFKKK